MRFPVVKGPLGCERLRQGDVLPDIAEVSEVRVRHARTSLRSRFESPIGELCSSMSGLPFIRDRAAQDQLSWPSIPRRAHRAFASRDHLWLAEREPQSRW